MAVPGARPRRQQGQPESVAERARRARQEGVVALSPLLTGATLWAGVLAGLGLVAEHLVVAVRAAAQAPLRASGREGEAAALLAELWAESGLPVLRGAGILLALLLVGGWLVGALQAGPILRAPWRPRRRVTPAPRRVGGLAALCLSVTLAVLAWLFVPDLTRLSAATAAWGPAIALRSLWLGACATCGVALAAGLVDWAARRAAGAASRRLGRLRRG